MRRMIKIIAAMLMTIGAVAGGTAATSPTATAGGSAKWGCPSGAVCIYTENGWWDDNPEHIYYSYGVHKLYDEYGDHAVFNNQYGGASTTLNTGSNGGGSHNKVVQDDWEWINLTPMNSITLKK